MRRNRVAARRLLLRRLLAEREIASQEELVHLLARRGHEVTQTTVSRDLAAIRAEKVVQRGSATRYLLRRGRRKGSRRLDDLSRILREFVTEIEHSRNLVVLKTPPGAASPVAAAVDRAAPDGVLGTLAGDDTVLVVTRAADGGSAMARRLAGLLEA